ncbi:interleukin 12Ba precursor [Amia ocellicauda]|uniref:interleukin 12Ba precursor n=1 Tax=Amia ocellicauda TaxID=2972642 RepID=UPI003463BD09
MHVKKNSLCTLFSQMNVLLQLLSILLLSLQEVRVYSQSESDVWIFKPNILVLEVNLEASPSSQVQLTCGLSYQGQDIHWKKENRALGQRGNQITVTIVEMSGGNFTCHQHSLGAVLNHTLVLVQERQNKKGEFPKTILKGALQSQRSGGENFIKCQAKNYNGDFECSWDLVVEPDDVMLSVSAERVGSSNGSSISCIVNGEKKGNATCLDSSFCPYSEEMDRINLTVYAIHEYRFESYSRDFYITEIVKPDKPADFKINCSKQYVWAYPPTWNQPHSYFPLTFQVRQAKHNCDSLEVKTDMQCSTQKKKGMNVICVRAKDMFTDSQWSDWSQWSQTKNGNKPNCHRQRRSRQRSHGRQQLHF